MITINIGRPRISLRKTTEEGEQPDVVDKIESIFTMRNFVLLGAGLSLGIILKQQSDIHTLKRTVEFLQEVVR